MEQRLITKEISTEQLLNKYSDLRKGTIEVNVSSLGNIYLDENGELYRVTHNGVPINKASFPAFPPELKSTTTIEKAQVFREGKYVEVLKGIDSSDVRDLLVFVAFKK